VTRARILVTSLALLGLAACTGTGIDAGGESNGSNGGVAFMILTAFLVVGALILWFILGRED
jgi:hypothetical protein